MTVGPTPIVFYWAATFAILAGPVAGSAIAGAASRARTPTSWTFGRSRCFACNADLKAIQTIPIVSYLASGRRCATCRAPISATYIVVETLGLVGPVAFLTLAGMNWVFVASIFWWGALAIAAIDAVALRAPHILSAMVGAAGLASAAFIAPSHLVGAAATAIVAYLVIDAARRAYRAARGREGLGGGDAAAAAALAAWIGPEHFAWVVAAAGAIGVAWALIAARRTGEPLDRIRIPFATCLAISAMGHSLLAAAMWTPIFWGHGTMS